jgi:hypothetical protein
MNDRIRVHCGDCDTRLAVPGSAAGKKVRCPKCKGVVAVPGPSVRPARDADVKRSQQAVGSNNRPPAGKKTKPQTEELFSGDDFSSEGEAVSSNAAPLPPKRTRRKKKAARPRLVGTGNEAPAGPKRIRQSFTDRLLHGGVITGLLTMAGAAA